MAGAPSAASNKVTALASSAARWVRIPSSITLAAVGFGTSLGVSWRCALRTPARSAWSGSCSCRGPAATWTSPVVRSWWQQSTKFTTLCGMIRPRRTGPGTCSCRRHVMLSAGTVLLPWPTIGHGLHLVNEFLGSASWVSLCLLPLLDAGLFHFMFFAITLLPVVGMLLLVPRMHGAAATAAAAHSPCLGALCLRPRLVLLGAAATYAVGAWRCCWSCHWSSAVCSLRFAW